MADSESSSAEELMVSWEEDGVVRTCVGWAGGARLVDLLGLAVDTLLEAKYSRSPAASLSTDSRSSDPALRFLEIGGSSTMSFSPGGTEDGLDGTLDNEEVS